MPTRGSSTSLTEMSVHSRSVRVNVDGAWLEGAVAPGEPVLEAAARLARVRPHDLDAVDLSGEPSLFIHGAAADPVRLRPMESGDLATMTRWRNTAAVARWWSEDPDDLDGLTAHYGPDLGPQSATHLWIAEWRGRSVGFIQDYLMSDHPEYAVLTGVPDAVGVDYLVGEPAFVGRGFGTRMLWSWLCSLSSTRVGVATAFAAPDHRNLASRRLLRKVGFTEGMWFDEPTSSGVSITVVGHSIDLPGVLGT